MNVQREEMRSMWVIVQLLKNLPPGGSVTREELLEQLKTAQSQAQAKVPTSGKIREAYMTMVLGEVDDGVATYEEAADLVDTSAAAVSQSVYRGHVVGAKTFRRGRPRSGVVLKSLLAFYGDVK